MGRELLVDNSNGELIVVARLEHMMENCPGSGDRHYGLVMQYTVEEVLIGSYFEDTMYVVHGAPELPRSIYFKFCGTLKQFEVGAVHKLRLKEKLIGNPSPFEAVVDPYLTSAPKPLRYLCIRADPWAPHLQPHSLAHAPHHHTHTHHTPHFTTTIHHSPHSNTQLLIISQLQQHYRQLNAAAEGETEEDEQLLMEEEGEEDDGVVRGGDDEEEDDDDDDGARNYGDAGSEDDDDGDEEDNDEDDDDDDDDDDDNYHTHSHSHSHAHSHSHSHSHAHSHYFAATGGAHRMLSRMEDDDDDGEEHDDDD